MLLTYMKRIVSIFFILCFVIPCALYAKDDKKKESKKRKKEGRKKGVWNVQTLKRAKMDGKT